MTSPSKSLIARKVSILLSDELSAVARGHCARLDGVSSDEVELYASELSKSLLRMNVHALGKENEGVFVSIDKAVEIRNRKEKPFFLVVSEDATPLENSSLDNSFERFRLDGLLAKVAEILVDELAETDAAAPINVIKASRFVTRQVDRWVTFLAEIAQSPTLSTVGLSLPLVGLVPDDGDEEMTNRIFDNIRVVKAISEPRSPASSIDERLGTANIAEGAKRMAISAFLEHSGIPLALPHLWCNFIKSERLDEFSFSEWPMAEKKFSDLESVELVPFKKPDGSLNHASKLSMDEDGQLFCEIGDESGSSVVIKWRTLPPSTGSVDKWQIELVPPADIRQGQVEPVATKRVSGQKRQATFEIRLNEEDLVKNGRFVIRLIPIDQSGDPLTVHSASDLEAESEEFDVIWTDDEIDRRARQSDSLSLANAMLDSAVKGIVSPAVQIGFDLAGAVMNVKLDRRLQKNVRISPVLLEVQNIQREAPGVSESYSIEYRSSAGKDTRPIKRRELMLPKAFQEKRTQLLTNLRDRGQLGFVESLTWDNSIRTEASGYVAAYKRALDAASGETLMGLLLLDSLSVQLSSGTDDVVAHVLLPTHPLRFAWCAQQSQLLEAWSESLVPLSANERQRSVDMNLVNQVIPSNLPFVTINVRGQRCVYAAELVFGAGLYIPDFVASKEEVLQQTCEALGIERNSLSDALRGDQATRRSRTYVDSHPNRASYRVAAVNPGRGDVVGRFLTPIVGDPQDLEDEDLIAVGSRAEVVVYANDWSFAKPVPGLEDLQKALRQRTHLPGSSHLNPPLRLAVRSVDEIITDDAGLHLALIQDIATSSIEFADFESERVASLAGLLTSIETRRVRRGEDVCWISKPAVRTTSGSGSDLAIVHASHQRAIAKIFGETGVPVSVFRLDANRAAQLRALHSRSDWVVTMDRNLGLDLYEDSEELGLGGSYILDYAPDFVEGITDRVTVTTTHREEILSILSRGMYELGLSSLGTETLVLDNLSVVSGRLALRLLSDSTQAREAVGIAATIAHLRRRGKLEGAIIVPIDSHQEIFGNVGKLSGEGRRRCDFLIVRVSSRRIQIQCVEVKNRQAMANSNALADRIVEQLNDTEMLLLDRFFTADPPRVDLPVQRSRLASLLHHYAERSRFKSLVEPSTIEEIHKNIDKYEMGGLSVEITKQGYVIALNGDHGVPVSHQGISIAVLTASDLGEAGFSTVLEDDAKRSDVLLGIFAEPIGPRDARKEPIALDSEASNERTNHERATKAIAEPPGDHSKSSTDSLTEKSPLEVSFESQSEVTHEKDLVEPTMSQIDVALGVDANNKEVVWSVSTQGSPHAFIVGIPGQGKSVTVRKIIRDFSDSGLPSMVFDFHGDMASNAPPGFTVLDVSNGLPFSPFELRSSAANDINAISLEISELVAYVCGLGEVQMMHVYKGLRKAYEHRGWIGGDAGNGLPTVEEFADAVEQVESGAKGRNARDRLRPLTDFGLFLDHPSGVFDPTGGGDGLIVDVHNITLESVQLAAAAFILRRIYRQTFIWGESKNMRLAVVLDEAHRLAKDRTLPKLMKEGRKYGVSVIVASQSVDDFHSDVLGNAGTKIVFRTNFPGSKTVSGFLRSRQGNDLSAQIEQLGVGEAYVSTAEINVARKVYMVP